jgi:hypothetical protein
MCRGAGDPRGCEKNAPANRAVGEPVGVGRRDAVDRAREFEERLAALIHPSARRPWGEK